MYKRYYDIDVDAKAYANRIVKAGGRIPSDIVSVSDFIKKLKINNLWWNMICWPLRANQNAGTGSNVYSLGNIGIYDGSLTSATWDINGLIFNGSSSRVSTTLNSITSDHTSISVFRYNSIAGNQAIFSKDDAGSNRQFNHISDGTSIAPAVFNPSARSMFVGSPSLGSFNYVTLRNSASLTNANRNDSSQTTATAGTMADGTANVFIGSLSNSIFFFNGAISFAAIINSYITDTDRSNFYSIYKSTLGKGLGLP